MSLNWKSQYIVWNWQSNSLSSGPHATRADAEHALTRTVETNYPAGDLRPYLVIAELPGE